MGIYDTVPTRRVVDGFDRAVPVEHADALSIFLRDKTGAQRLLHRIAINEHTTLELAKDNARAYIQWHTKQFGKAIK